jgi:hypothetical protein
MLALKLACDALAPDESHVHATSGRGGVVVKLWAEKSEAQTTRLNNESASEPAGDRVINPMDALDQSLKRAKTETSATRRKVF